jgi:hypothetical protein
LQRKNRSAFPFYLNAGLSTTPLRWLGKRLRALRGKRTTMIIARRANIRISDVEALEAGVFALTVGRLRDVVREGYGTDFTNLLAECYDANPEYFGKIFHRHLPPFVRDHYFSLSVRQGENDREATPLLIGGHSTRYLWAIPMRTLRNQKLLLELLELAPARKKSPTGFTPNSSHNGTDVIHVVHGSVDYMAIEGEDFFTQYLRAGDSFCFFASRQHTIENIGNSTSALLLIVHVP